MFQSSYQQGPAKPDYPVVALLGFLILLLATLVLLTKAPITRGFENLSATCTDGEPQYRAQNAILDIHRDVSMLLVGDAGFLDAARQAFSEWSPSFQARLITIEIAQLDFQDLQALSDEQALRNAGPAMLVFQSTPSLWSGMRAFGPRPDMSLFHAQRRAREGFISRTAIRQGFDLLRHCLTRGGHVDETLEGGALRFLKLEPEPRYLRSFASNIKHLEGRVFMTHWYDRVRWLDKNPALLSAFEAELHRLGVNSFEVTSLPGLAARVAGR